MTRRSWQQSRQRQKIPQRERARQIVYQELAKDFPVRSGNLTNLAVALSIKLPPPLSTALRRLFIFVLFFFKLVSRQVLKSNSNWKETCWWGGAIRGFWGSSALWDLVSAFRRFPETCSVPTVDLCTDKGDKERSGKGLGIPRRYSFRITINPFHHSSL